MSTYGSANSICGWSLLQVSRHLARWQHALTVIGATQYPWQLVVEEDGSDIVQVTVQCEKTAPGLV